MCWPRAANPGRGFDNAGQRAHPAWKLYTDGWDAGLGDPSLGASEVAVAQRFCSFRRIS